MKSRYFQLSFRQRVGSLREKRLRGDKLEKWKTSDFLYFIFSPNWLIKNEIMV